MSPQRCTHHLSSPLKPLSDEEAQATKSWVAQQENSNKAVFLLKQTRTSRTSLVCDQEAFNQPSCMKPLGYTGVARDVRVLPVKELFAEVECMYAPRAPSSWTVKPDLASASAYWSVATRMRSLPAVVWRYTYVDIITARNRLPNLNTPHLSYVQSHIKGSDQWLDGGGKVQGVLAL